MQQACRIKYGHAVQGLPLNSMLSCNSRAFSPSPSFSLFPAQPMCPLACPGAEMDRIARTMAEAVIKFEFLLVDPKRQVKIGRTVNIHPIWPGSHFPSSSKQLSLELPILSEEGTLGSNLRYDGAFVLYCYARLATLELHYQREVEAGIGKSCCHAALVAMVTYHGHVVLFPRKIPSTSLSWASRLFLAQRRGDFMVVLWSLCVFHFLLDISLKHSHSLSPSLFLSLSVLLQEEWQLVFTYVLQFPRLLREAGMLKGEGLRVDSHVRKVSRKICAWEGGH